MDRRGLLRVASAGALGALLPAQAGASVSRALRLEQLVGRSRHVILGEPLEGYSVWETIGDRRHIVSYTRVRTHELLAGDDPGQEEILVRTLGGRVGKLGELVPGEARLRLNTRGVLFTMLSGQTLTVTAMAQGHYPLRRDAEATEWLQRSPEAMELINEEGSAVRRLNGLRINEARTLLREVKAR
jgi:hypothetical protein